MKGNEWNRNPRKHDPDQFLNVAFCRPGGDGESDSEGIGIESR